MLTTPRYITLTADPKWTERDILREVERTASRDGQAYDTDFSGIGSYEYFGASGFDKYSEYLIPEWSDVVVVGLTEEQVFSMEEFITFKMVVDDMEAEIDCKVVWDEESDLTLFTFTNAD
jgi:hypothetical protein